MERNDKLETGQQLLNTLMSRVEFLSNGLTRAFLNKDGNTPFEKLTFTIFGMVGISKNSRRLVGIGSITGKLLA